MMVDWSEEAKFKTITRQAAEIDKLREENRQMREALHKIAYDEITIYEFGPIARKALK